MNALRIAILVLHFVGLAAIIGPAFEQLKSATKKITKTMVWGARAQVVTGVILVGLAYANDIAVDNGKISVKLVIALAIAAVAEMTAKRTNAPKWAYWAVSGLTLLNIIVAVAWK